MGPRFPDRSRYRVSAGAEGSAAMHAEWPHRASANARAREIAGDAQAVVSE